MKYISKKIYALLKVFNSISNIFNNLFFSLFTIKNNRSKFYKSCSYKFLREVLKERWGTLNKIHTYPNLINHLKIK